MKTHIDPNIEKIIGREVSITFFDGRVVNGLLMHNTYGDKCPYKVVCREYDYGFYKSHVKKIKVVNLRVLME